MKCIFKMHVLAPVGQYIISAEMSGSYKEKNYCVLHDMILVNFLECVLKKMLALKARESIEWRPIF